MARFQAAPLNWLHVMLVLIVAVVVVGGSIALLPEEFIDYGILAAFLLWTGYIVVSQWRAAPLHRALTFALAIAFLSATAFLLWPFDHPM
jgi:hypothetical protein